jgi:hypothetical protein
MEASRIHIAAGLRPVSQTRRDGPADRPEVPPSFGASGACALQVPAILCRLGARRRPRADEPTSSPSPRGSHHTHPQGACKPAPGFDSTVLPAPSSVTPTRGVALIALLRR